MSANPTSPAASTYPRDMIGYGRQPPHAQWPGQARIALQFVLNYEEGSENSVLHGDAGSEQFLSEIIGADSYPARHMSMESMYEYGSRAGVWRILREFEQRGLPLTVFGVAMALQRNPDATQAFLALGHEIACHGWRWLHYQKIPIEVEREHMRIAVDIMRELTGSAPLGWYTGRDSPNTRQLLIEQGGFIYDADHYGDDLPFWTTVARADGSRRQHLVVPYTLDCNDMRFASPQGFNTAEQFYQYLKDSFDVLYAEGEIAPKMLSIGMHCRLLGRPGRLRALQRFLDYVQSHDKVWITRRIDIANHWMQTHPAPMEEKSNFMQHTMKKHTINRTSLSTLNRIDADAFTALLGGIFEHSPWIAVKAAPDRPYAAIADLHAAMCRQIEQSDDATRLCLIRAHPELAGKAALHGELTAESTREQQGAGLDACNAEEFERLQALNSAYNQKFGFPFIVAVRGHTRHSILTLMESRLQHDEAEEMRQALRQIYQIALYRLYETIEEN